MSVRNNPKALQAFMSIGGSDTKSALWSSVVPLSTLVGFRHSRTAGDVGTTFQGTFIDHSAYEMENALVGLGNSIQSRTLTFQYGYDTTSEGMSRVFHGFIYDYAPSIVGNIVQIEIMSVGRADVQGTQNAQLTQWDTWYSNTRWRPSTESITPRSLPDMTTLPGQMFSPSELVKSICRSLNWNISDIVPTKSIRSSMISGIVISQISNPLEFIRRTLVPLSESLSGASNYAFWTETTSNGSVVAHFRPQVTATNSTGSFSYSSSGVNDFEISSEVAETFDYNHTNSVIIDWQPVVSGGALMAIGGSNTTASTFDEATNEDYYVEANNMTSQLPKDSQRQWLPTEGQSASLKFSSASTDQVNRAVSSHWQEVMNYQYVVNCTLEGDPRRKVMETLDFNIYSGGRLHHTSGRYLVTGVQDIFSLSGWQTQLELLKNSAYTGPVSSGTSNSSEDSRSITSPKGGGTSSTTSEVR